MVKNYEKMKGNWFSKKKKKKKYSLSKYIAEVNPVSAP